ncbi:MAG: EAL domain-containing protein [Gammaproteobacteria bacterium]|nr:EAL domain-containing protein [Gammaproteobacteria bacterium]
MRALRRHIGTRITLLMTGLLAILLLGGSQWLNDRLDEMVRQWEARQARTHANTLLSTLQTLMLNGEGTLARDWINRMHGIAGILDIEVLRQDGKEAFTDLATVSAVNGYLGALRFEREPVEGHHRGEPLHPPAFEQALRGENGIDWSIPGRMTLYLPIPTREECLGCHGYDPASLRGVLRLGLSTADIEQWAAQLQRRATTGIIVLLLFSSLVLTGAVQWTVLTPLARLRKAIVDIGENRQAARLDIAREDEVGQVACAFNRLQGQLLAVTDNVPDALLTCNEQGRIITANRAAGIMFGDTPEHLIGQNIALLIPDIAKRYPADSADAQGNTASRAWPGQRWESTALRRDGTRPPVEVSLNAYRLEDKRRLIAVVRDITERKAQLATIEHQALHDPLTDLPNRALLSDRLRQAIRAADRSGEPLALMIMDLNRFKEINDTLGHLQGDLLLQQVAARLPPLMRASDTVARLGGDEFALVLPRSDAESAARIAERINQSLEEPFKLEEHTYTIGASIGIALYPTHGRDDVNLLQCADTAMYAAKRRRIGYDFYSPEQDEQNAQALKLLGDLRRAIGTDQLMLHYQPKVDLRTHCVTGVEALLRWNHPERGSIPPAEFIAIAERYGITGVLTAWVIEEAMRQMYAWELDGIELGIAVNLSMHDLENDQLIRHVERYRAENSDARTHRLCLEVTETAMMSNPPRVFETLNTLADMGFVISIDDFGTGYSSLNYLRQLPLSEIKIDKSFVMDMLHNKEAATIVHAVIDLAHNLGLRVVAEGVAEQAILERLQGIGCDIAQGFHIARPMGAAALNDWLESAPWGKEGPAPARD